MWSDPVVFETGVQGKIRSVHDSVEALQVLDGWWQKFDGAAFHNAINVCIASIRNETSSENARAAFISALSEGGIHIKPLN